MKTFRQNISPNWFIRSDLTNELLSLCQISILLYRMEIIYLLQIKCKVTIKNKPHHGLVQNDCNWFVALNKLDISSVGNVVVGSCTTKVRSSITASSSSLERWDPVAPSIGIVAIGIVELGLLVPALRWWWLRSSEAKSTESSISATIEESSEKSGALPFGRLILTSCRLGVISVRSFGGGGIFLAENYNTNQCTDRSYFEVNCKWNLNLPTALTANTKRHRANSFMATYKWNTSELN